MNLNVTSNVNQSILPSEEPLDLSCRSNRMTENVRMNPDSLRPLIHPASDQYSPLPDWRVTITNPKISSTVTTGMLNDPTFQALSVSASRDPNNRKKTDKKVKVYFCDVCGNEFERKGYLTEHKIIHFEKKDYSCEVCDKAFGRKCDLKRHNIVHVEDKVYFCKVCGKGFKRKDNLRQHIKLHSGKRERIYSCSFCGKTFLTISNHNQHIRNSHIIKDKDKGTKGKGTEKKDKSCEICGKMFESKTYLQTHMRIHTGEKPYTCSICDKRFNQKSQFTIHMHLHHNKQKHDHNKQKHAGLLESGQPEK